MKLFFKYNEHSQVYNNTNLLDTNIILCTQNSDNINDMHIHYNFPPYDSKIEYLKSTGTQWIDTGFKHTGNTRFVCQLNLSGDLSVWRYPFGSYGNVKGTNKLFCVEINGSQKLATYYGTVNSGSNTAHNFNINPSGTHTFDLNKNVHKIDNTTYTYTYSNFSSLYNTLIFGVTNYEGNTQRCTTTIQLYYFKIYENDILIRDFIPVRVGQIGCLFDIVSGQLYGNAGSGDFILGPDIN